jgi:hypothetical protein
MSKGISALTEGIIFLRLLMARGMPRRDAEMMQEYVMRIIRGSPESLIKSPKELHKMIGMTI